MNTPMMTTVPSIGEINYDPWFDPEWDNYQDADWDIYDEDDDYEFDDEDEAGDSLL